MMVEAEQPLESANKSGPTTGYSGVQRVKGFKRRHEGRWGIGNKPQYSRVYIKDPLTHLPSSHLSSPLEEGGWEGGRVDRPDKYWASTGQGSIRYSQIGNYWLWLGVFKESMGDLGLKV